MLERLTVRMDGNKNHGRAHLHIDYGYKHHAASYSVDTAERLVGDLETKYDQAVRSWIETQTETVGVVGGDSEPKGPTAPSQRVERGKGSMR